jgi:hypothetical protein
MLSFADSRSFEASDERFSRCQFCGREVVILPDDRRRGACFDCLALSVPQPMPCPDCGATIPGEERGLGCPVCRWYPLRD